MASMQYLPAAVNVGVAGETAVPRMTVAEPKEARDASPATWEQSGKPARSGPQRKNSTLPVTAPFACVPASVAVSVTVLPMPTLPEEALVVKVGGSGASESVFIDRSWFPPTPSTEMIRWWYGDPLIEPAALPAPQSICEPMWPPHAASTSVLGLVKCTVSCSLSPPFDEAQDIEVIVPFQIVTLPATGVLPPGRVTHVAVGIAKVDGPLKGP